MLAHVHTLGCKLNYAEGSSLAKSLVARGYTLTDDATLADLFVVNTCSVTENANRECRQIVRRQMRERPGSFVVVTGCYAQLEPEEVASIDGVDIVLGTEEKIRAAEYLPVELAKLDVPKIFATPINDVHEFGPAATSEGDSRTRAFLKVQDGCDYNCAFCTIPMARGESRSAGVDFTVGQAQMTRSQGFKEIVLTGVNIGDYGKKLDTSFLELCRALDTAENIPNRLRISSIEPNLLSNEIIDLVADSKRFCEHFHVPLQSGSDTILKSMRRRYDTALYRDRIHHIKEKIPHCGIGVDVITGFPGETNKHFEETAQFLTELPVSYLHVFSYSERPNTFAAEMKSVVPVNERCKRNHVLRELSEKKRRAFYESNLGSEQEVLFEHKVEDGLMFGWTRNYIRVAVPAEEKYLEQVVVVRLKTVEGEYCRVS